MLHAVTPLRHRLSPCGSSVTLMPHTPTLCDSVRLGLHYLSTPLSLLLFLPLSPVFLRGSVCLPFPLLTPTFLFSPPTFPLFAVVCVFGYLGQTGGTFGTCLPLE